MTDQEKSSPIPLQDSNTEANNHVNDNTGSNENNRAQKNEQRNQRGKRGFNKRQGKKERNAKKEKEPKETIDDIDETTAPKTLFYFHPDELWLKGKNKPMFVQALQSNMNRQYKLANIKDFKVTHENDQMFLTCNPEDEEKIIEVSKKIFGICNFGRCYRIQKDMETLKSECLKKFSEFHQIHKVSSFRVECSRQDKKFELTSPEICKLIGEVIFTNLNIPAKMKEPEVSLFIEVRHKCFLFYYEKIDGAHGLPVGSSGRTAVLLSGGFDSPVAAWTVMRRGCAARLIHFHSAPFGEWKSSVSKVRKIVQQLSLWGGPLKFYAVPIGEQQRIIAKDAPERLRVTLYRRLMLRIAREISEKERCISLTTGDSLGQVASQTIESMTTIQSVISPFLVMRPLIGSNKTSIIKKARRIGTHDISVLPAGDCCSHMLPKKPATKPSIEEAEEGEKNLNIEEMVQSAIAAMQLIDINEPWNDEDDEVLSCPL
ncbi:thiamine biosynthesis protein ThiI [Tritrichomonas foetus]|uniref:Thiamine biosynthesis protein ThiI n=1 Tax=Tritrichomonas foetus TaxID=1144522 RepID=A0A1J4JE70_9EUKA|nr:thiamine biosynthesis protein ThiI [Tritrichomonas foetus]|eukprot:OHS96945.1 thiamine biosynthesis protein ThiI [Tritrichomonas foetus]